MRLTNSKYLLVAVWLGGCNLGGNSSTQKGAEVEEGKVDPTKSPLAALGQLKKASEELVETAKKMEEQQRKDPVEPLNYQSLVELLPQVDGWKSAEPNGEKSQLGEWKISRASTEYTRSDDEKRSQMKVEIVDGSYVPLVYMPFTTMSKFTTESTTGHKKGLKIRGQPAFEEWARKSERIKLVVLVKDRFIVTIEGRGVDPGAAREWVGRLNLEKLAGMADKKGSVDQARGKSGTDSSL